jgi:hypothetical protein
LSATNPVRPCLGCGQSDDHPRHVIDVGGVDTFWHYDCHAQVTNCELCVPVAKAAEGKTGDELRKHLTSRKG